MSDDLLGRAWQLQQAGHLADAADLYHQVLRTNPRQVEALYALGLIYLQNGRFDRAEYLLGEASALAPGSPEALSLRGIALLNLGRHQQAIGCFDRALAINPGDVAALSNRATALFELQLFDEALAGFDAALALDPAHAVSWNNRGNLLLAQKRYVEALASYDRALAAKPEFQDAKLNRLRLFRLAGGDPNLAETLRVRGAGHLAGSRYKEALAAFDDSLLARPTPDGLFGRGSALAGLGREEEAQKWFEIARLMRSSAPAQ